MSSDIWSIVPAVDDDMFFAAASIAGAGAITLLTNTVSQHGAGYKLVITSTGNESAKTFTVVGKKVGSNINTTEAITGPNATTVLSTNFYAYVDSVSIDGASVGNVKVGTSGSLALPRTRIKSVYYVGAASAGSISVNLNSSTGAILLQINTPAGATADAFSVPMPENGILTQRTGSEDLAVVTLTNVTYATLFCG